MASIVSIQVWKGAIEKTKPLSTFPFLDKGVNSRKVINNAIVFQEDFFALAKTVVAPSTFSLVDDRKC